MTEEKLVVYILAAVIIGLVAGLLIWKLVSDDQGLFITRDPSGRITEILRKKLP